MGVIGSERWQERVGGLKQVCCSDFFSSVLTQFAISFKDHHYWLPNFNISSSIEVCKLFWVRICLDLSGRVGERGIGLRVPTFSRDNLFTIIVVVNGLLLLLLLCIPYQETL